MDQSMVFKWISRINSILFLILLASSLALAVYLFHTSNQFGQPNEVQVNNNDANDGEMRNLRLSDIQQVCGTDTQFVDLSSNNFPDGLSSGGINSLTRNVVFFVGKEMTSHWLFDTNRYLIEKMNILTTSGDNCAEEKTASIYYEVVKNDTDKNGKLDGNDKITVALTTPDGSNYREIATGLDSVIDHSVNSAGTELTILVQKDNQIEMDKFALHSGQLISTRVLTGISKHR